ncbi:MAG: hypothetical protein WCZ98_01405 [Sideroxydans sp.]
MAIKGGVTHTQLAAVLASAVAAQASADNALAGSFYNKSWVDQTANRESGTVYTNNTGKPIEVRSHWQATVASCTLSYSVGGIATTFTCGNASGLYMPISFIVPVGAQYSITGTNFNKLAWAEL